MRLNFIVFAFLSLSFIKYYGQNVKQKITPETYNKWKKIDEPQISENGNIISYVVAPPIGDQELIIKNKFINKSLTIERGKKVIISPNENWVAFSIENYYDSIRSLKLKKTAKKDWPIEHLAIYNTKKDSLTVFKEVKSWKYGFDEGNWIALKRTEHFDKKEKPEEKKRKWWRIKKQNEEIKVEENGTILTLYNPLTFEKINIRSVDNYTIDKSGNTVYYSTTKTYNDSIDSCNLYLFNTKNGSIQSIHKSIGKSIQFSASKNGDQFAFLNSKDTSKIKTYQLYYWNSSLDSCILIADTISSNFNSDKSVSEFHTSYFSDNGNYLFFNVGKKPLKSEKDTLTEDEKYSLDLWSWTDDIIQSQQLNTLEKDKKKADLYVYNTSKKIINQLTESDDYDQIVDNDKTHNKPYIIVKNQAPYLKEMTWDGWYYDYYKINIETGARKLLVKKHDDAINVSESGEKIAYYSKVDSSWFCQNLINNEITQLTKEKIFHYNQHDIPGLPNSAGNCIWSEDESYVVIKGQYDYWKCFINEKPALRLTFGREKSTIYNYWKTNNENERTINLNDTIYFKTYNEINKKEGVSMLNESKIETLFNHDKKISFLVKAKKSTTVLYREMSFKEYPDLQKTDLTFKTFKNLSNVNPQQKDYNWGSVQLVSWKSYHNNDSLSGLLYKPDNFDSTKSYPMIVYFYERNTHNFHRYYAPKPTASIVYPTEYVSNGYLVFIPDIIYQVGKPGQSAYDCIVSGTDYLTKTYAYIDSNRMGLQGQSWGGYQTVQLITMTNKYKCAMAGAPVSNMFSAYGGIRWKSGLNRAFQYEKGQSRIGQTIWEAPELYIENSPLFHLQKVNTPLLIMHNDGDGAVPWTQGLELFNGLRRLQKPVWLLNYNKDAHNLRKRANKIDLSIRMKQFFDYYLLEKQPIDWIKNGRPAVIKELENSN